MKNDLDKIKNFVMIKLNEVRATLDKSPNNLSSSSYFHLCGKLSILSEVIDMMEKMGEKA